MGLKNHVCHVARLNRGCRIGCRLVEHARGGVLVAFVDELLTDCSRLCRHQFGHHVIETVLEHCRSYIEAIVDTLLADMKLMVCNMYACHVFEKTLECCSESDKLRLGNQLLGD